MTNLSVGVIAALCITTGFFCGLSWPRPDSKLLEVQVTDTRPAPIVRCDHKHDHADRTALESLTQAAGDLGCLIRSELKIPAQWRPVWPNMPMPSAALCSVRFRRSP